MSDRRRELQGMFDGADSWDRFGDMLTRMHAGFRCHTNTVVDVTCPITASGSTVQANRPFCNWRQHLQRLHRPVPAVLHPGLPPGW